MAFPLWLPGRFRKRCCQGAIGPPTRPAADGDIGAAPVTGAQILHGAGWLPWTDVSFLLPHTLPPLSHAGEEFESIPHARDEQQGHNDFADSHHEPCMHHFPLFRQAAGKAGGPYAPARKCFRLGLETRVGRFISGRVVSHIGFLWY